MEDVSIKLGDKVFTLEIAETPDDRYDGLADDPDLADNEGMIFIFEGDGPHPMVMRGMEIPLDIVHVNGEGVINTIATAEPGDAFEFEGDVNSRYVIEVGAGEIQKAALYPGSRIKLPSSFTQYIGSKYGVGTARKGARMENAGNVNIKMYDVKTTDIPEKGDHMQVLDHDGKVISNIKEGARIFSRPHTKELVAAANAGEDDESLKRLGMMIVNMIHQQDTQKPEYST